MKLFVYEYKSWICFKYVLELNKSLFNSVKE